MIPQPIASLVVSRAITADSAVDERASIECFRHHGYASASQIVSKPPSSIARACSRISSSGPLASCMPPTRNGCAIALQPGDDVARLLELHAGELAQLLARSELVASRC